MPLQPKKLLRRRLQSVSKHQAGRIGVFQRSLLGLLGSSHFASSLLWISLFGSRGLITGSPSRGSSVCSSGDSSECCSWGGSEHYSRPGREGCSGGSQEGCSDRGLECRALIESKVPTSEEVPPKEAQKDVPEEL